MRGAAQKLLRATLKRLLGAAPTRLRVLIHEESGGVGTLDLPGSQVRMHVDSFVEWRTRLHSCKKEPDTIEWLQGSLRPGDVLYDIGSNVGAYALAAAALSQSDVRVFAFEPSAPNYAQLCRNIVLNRFGARVVPIPIALTAAPGLVNFGYSDLTPGAALHDSGSAEMHPEVGHSVLGATLDSLVSVYSLKHPTHIKVDVDGAEVGVIRGATDVLRSPTLRTVLIELDQSAAEYSMVDAMLREAGLTCTSKRRCIPGSTDPRLMGYHNFVYSRT